VRKANAFSKCATTYHAHAFHTHIYTRTNTCILKCTHAHSVARTPTHISTNTHTHIHTYIHTHTHKHTHKHIHTYIHTYIHTHTHTNTLECQRDSSGAIYSLSAKCSEQDMESLHESAVCPAESDTVALHRSTRSDKKDRETDRNGAGVECAHSNMHEEYTYTQTHVFLCPSANTNVHIHTFMRINLRLLHREMDSARAHTHTRARARIITQSHTNSHLLTYSRYPLKYTLHPLIHALTRL